MAKKFGNGGCMVLDIIKDKEVWDQFVKNNQDCLLFHSWAFLEIIEKYSGYTLIPYGFFDEKKKIIGICPLFIKKYGGIKFVFSQPPKSGIPYIGPIFDSKYNLLPQHQKESFFKRAIHDLNAELIKNSVRYTSITLIPKYTDIREFVWHEFSVNCNYSYVFDLKQPLTTIWNNLDTDCRREIRSAEKSNLKIQETDKIIDFFIILKKRYQEQKINLPVLNPEYLHSLHVTYPDLIKSYFVYNNEKIINLVSTYQNGSRLTIWKGMVNLDRRIHSNEYLIWEFIKQAQNNGLQQLEIEGANVERLCRFKSKFNPSLECNFTVTKSDYIGKLSEYFYLKFIRGG